MADETTEAPLPPGAAKGSIRDNLEVVCFAMVLILFFKTYVGQQFKIPSASMRNTLMIGDHLLANKFIFATPQWSWEEKLFPMRPVKRGDIIVFRFPSEDPREFQCGGSQYGKDFIKRVIGLPGDTVEVRQGRVFINGQPLKDEPYAQYLDQMRYPAGATNVTRADYQSFWENRMLGKMYSEYIRDNFGPVKVPPGDYFAMGDNRDRSCDSRYWGPVPGANIKGEAWFTYWPPSRVGFPE